MKDVELKLLSALMKNSHRSDRILAKIVGVSQPTITRTRTKLEKEGYIKEYTMIPDFGRLGFQIMSFTLVKLKKDDPKTIEHVRKQMRESLREKRIATLLALTGLGSGADRITIAFHQNYSEYVDFMTAMKQHPAVNIEDMKSFLVNLQDQNHYQPLTFYEIAEYLPKMKKGE